MFSFSDQKEYLIRKRAPSTALSLVSSNWGTCVLFGLAVKLRSGRTLRTSSDWPFTSEDMMERDFSVGIEANFFNKSPSMFATPSPRFNDTNFDLPNALTSSAGSVSMCDKLRVCSFVKATTRLTYSPSTTFPETLILTILPDESGEAIKEVSPRAPTRGAT